MYPNKYLMKLINYFLPRQAEIVRIGEDYQIRAILQVDLDGDQEEELVSLYTEKGKYYLLILKKRGRRWYVIWNNLVDYQSITHLESIKWSTRGRQVLIGGKKVEEGPSELSLVTWKKTEIEVVEVADSGFDKLYIQRVDEMEDLDQVILWKHQKLEAYSIDIYRYQAGRLVKDAELDHHYFETIVKYYTYLCEREPEESIYQVYLEEAKRRCLPRARVHRSENIAKVVNGVNEEIGDRDKPLDNKIEKSKQGKEILEIVSGYLQDMQEEQEIYLWGKKDEEAGQVTISEATLILTSNGKQVYGMLPIPSEKFYSYQLFIGDFTGNGLDDIWIGLEESSGRRVMIYTIQEEKIVQIWDTAYLEESEYQTTKKILEIYAIDKMLRGKYEVWYVQASKETDSNGLERVMTCSRWEGNRMTIYKQYKIQEEVGV